jgi:hypothetical protein
MTILLNPENKEIHSAMGRAIDAYANVEGSQVFLLETILGISTKEAVTIFFAVQNVRFRHEMFEQLLSAKHKDKYNEFWNKCGSFLEKLSKFRNAIVHWAPMVAIHRDKSGKVVQLEHKLGHPSKSLLDITTTSISDFVKDCRYIQQEISALKRSLMDDDPALALPDKFQKPNLRRNLAVLQPPPKPKAPQPRRPPSVPKLSAAQKRAKALKAARISSKDS